MKVSLRNTEECEVYIAKVEKALRKAGIDVVKKTDVTDETDAVEAAHLCVDVRKGGQLKKETEYWKHVEKVREERLKKEQDMSSITIDKIDARVCRSSLGCESVESWRSGEGDDNELTNER